MPLHLEIILFPALPPSLFPSPPPNRLQLLRSSLAALLDGTALAQRVYYYVVRTRTRSSSSSSSFSSSSSSSSCHTATSTALFYVVVVAAAAAPAHSGGHVSRSCMCCCFSYTHRIVLYTDTRLVTDWPSDASGGAEKRDKSKAERRRTTIDFGGKKLFLRRWKSFNTALVTIAESLF